MILFPGQIILLDYLGHSFVCYVGIHDVSQATVPLLLNPLLSRHCSTHPWNGHEWVNEAAEDTNFLNIQRTYHTIAQDVESCTNNDVVGHLWK